MDKWLRAEMALRAGVDLVIELPLPWACNSAPRFATGAVQCLNALGGIDALCFGSESGSLETLQNCCDLLSTHEKRLEKHTPALLRQGLTYPQARQQVLAEVSEDTDLVAPFATSNNILGIEYLKALKETDSAMKPLTLSRLGAGYHDREAIGGIASATGIRNLITERKSVERLMPREVYPLMVKALSAGQAADAEMFFRLLQGRIFRGADSLCGLYQVENGLALRLLEVAQSANSLEELIAGIKARQLTRTRIQRILCQVFNEVERGEMEAFLQCGPLYLHLLAAGPGGRKYLAACRKKLQIPLVGNYSRIHSVLKRRYGAGTENYGLARAQLEMELRATRNYTLLMRRWGGGNNNRDFFEAPRSL